MKEEIITDELLIRYVLGQLSQEEQERVEDRMFEDRQFFERLLVVEDDLIDSYASGRLTEDERRRFEGRFLKTKEDVERISFARELAAYVSRDTPSKRARWLEFVRIGNPPVLVPLAAILLIAMGALWLVFQIVRLNDRLDEMRTQIDVQEKRGQELEQQVAEERSRNQQLLEELERERRRSEIEDRFQSPAQALAPGLVSFILSPGAVRDGSSATKLAIPPDAGRVRLQALFKTGDYPGFSAELQTVEGRVLWRRAGLKGRKSGENRAVTISVPANVLGEDDYILVIKGVSSAGEEESVGEYFFRVVKKQ